MTRSFRRERGLTLLITLIMLVVITLFVVSMIRLNSINTAIVNNMRAQKMVDAEAQQQIEIALNKFQFFDDVISAAGSWSDPSTTYLAADTLWANTSYRPTGGGTTRPATQTSAANLKIYRPQCTYWEPSSGYSALSGVAPQDTYWDMKATASDSTSGASTEIHQGIQIRLPAGNCK